MEKKWPILGRILIGLMCVNCLFLLISTIFLFVMIAAQKQFSMFVSLLLVIYLALAVILFYFYRFKLWALWGLTGFFSLKILLDLVGFITSGFQKPVALFFISLSGLFIYYFNSASIRSLFNEKKVEQEPVPDVPKVSP